MFISPSILSADFTNLEAELRRISSADFAHLDVMDGHFVPNLTFGLPVIERITKVTDLTLDTHLMIENPDHWAPKYAAVTQGLVTFHVETAQDVAATAANIRAAGGRPSVAIKPGTPFAQWAHVVDFVDMVLVMTVEPGFGGQSFMAEQMQKVQHFRDAIAASGREVLLEVDGGVTVDTIGQCIRAGADVFVSGSGVYGYDNPKAAIAALRKAAQSARDHHNQA